MHETRYSAKLCLKLGSVSRLGDRLGVRLGAQLGLTRRLYSGLGTRVEARPGLVRSWARAAARLCSDSAWLRDWLDAYFAILTVFV